MSRKKKPAPEPWQGYVRNCVRAYPRQCAAVDAIERARESGDPPHELLKLDAARKREYDAVAAAVQMTSELEDGKLRLAVVDMVHWTQSHTITGAAGACYVSERTAQRFQQEFFRCVASHLGLT